MGRKALTPNLPERSQGDPTDPKKPDRAGMNPHRVPGASLEQEMDGWRIHTRVCGAEGFSPP